MAKEAVIDSIRSDTFSSPTPRVRQIGLVLAESYPLLLDGMDRLFRSEPGFHVLACCKDGDEALRAVRNHRPDVLVLDLRLNGKGALTLLREVPDAYEMTRVVLLADTLGEDEMLQATHLGARGIVLKSMASRLLVECVRKVHRGDVWIEKVSIRRAMHQLLRPEPEIGDADRLTHRELEVLRMAACGYTNKQIADKLSVCVGTVKAHVHHVYEKLGVRGRLELLLYARDRGLIQAVPSDRRDRLE